MVRVSAISVARKMKLLVMFSQRSVRCSPTKASWKPSRSASRMVSRSSRKVCTGSRSAGCIGIMKSPRRILRPPLVGADVRFLHHAAPLGVVALDLLDRLLRREDLRVAAGGADLVYERLVGAGLGKRLRPARDHFL